MNFKIRATKFLIAHKTSQTCAIPPSKILMLKLNASYLKNITHFNILKFVTKAGLNHKKKKKEKRN